MCSVIQIVYNNKKEKKYQQEGERENTTAVKRNKNNNTKQNYTDTRTITKINIKRKLRSVLCLVLFTMKR